MQKAIKEIQKAIDKFNESIPKTQSKIFDRLNELVKELDLKNGKIEQSVKNLKLITKIKSEIESIVFSKEYVKAVNEYVNTFDTVTKLQGEYFRSLDKKFSPPKLANEIRKQSIQSTIDSLTEAGIGNNVTNKIQDILRQNITTGAKFSDLSNQLRNFIVTNETGAGALERYSKQITTDALNQYSANYTKLVTDDLGLEWYMYDGALIETSRCFCEALVKKKYFHKSEIENIVAGKFDEYKDKECEDGKNGLPAGMITGTNAANFFVYRGGYNCGHQVIPISKSIVPERIRKQINP